MISILMTTTTTLNTSKLFGKNVELITPNTDNPDITPTRMYFIPAEKMYIPEEFVSEVIEVDEYPDDLNTGKYVYIKGKGFIVDENWAEPPESIADDIPDDVKDRVVDEIKQEVTKNVD